MLLSAVLLIMQVFTLYAYERNTEEFYYLYEHKDDYEEVVNPISEDSPVTSYEELEASKMAYAEEYGVYFPEINFEILFVLLLLYFDFC